jgi:hypothetical protein
MVRFIVSFDGNRCLVLQMLKAVLVNVQTKHQSTVECGDILIFFFFCFTFCRPVEGTEYIFYFLLHTNSVIGPNRHFFFS